MSRNQKKYEVRDKNEIKEEEKEKYTLSADKSEDGKVKKHMKEKDKSPKHNPEDVSSIFFCVPSSFLFVSLTCSCWSSLHAQPGLNTLIDQSDSKKKKKKVRYP